MRCRYCQRSNGHTTAGTVTALVGAELVIGGIFTKTLVFRLSHGKPPVLALYNAVFGQLAGPGARYRTIKRTVGGMYACKVVGSINSFIQQSPGILAKTGPAFSIQ